MAKICLRLLRYLKSVFKLNVQDDAMLLGVFIIENINPFIFNIFANEYNSFLDLKVSSKYCIHFLLNSHYDKKK